MQYCNALLLKVTFPNIAYTYNSQQFPAEMNTWGSKTPISFIPIYTKYDYSSRLTINKDLSFPKIPWMVLCYDFITLLP